MKLSYREYNEGLIAVDIETKDPFLLDKGNGVYRKDGHILGVSFSNGEISEYYPLNHLDTTPEEKEKNSKYIESQLLRDNRKVFANGMYDLDWLVNGEGHVVNGKFEDVQIAEPLLDEYKRSYSLNNLAKEYLGETKLYSKPAEYAIQHRYIKEGMEKKAIGHLWKMPYEVVREYAEADSKLTYQILQHQKIKLEEQGLTEIYELEMRLYPLLLQMRKEGVRVDKEKLAKTGLALAAIQYDIQQQLNQDAGRSLNVNSNKDLEQLFLKMHLPVYYGEPTDKMDEKGLSRGNPKFNKETLNKYNHEIVNKIQELRHIKTLLSLFINPYPDLVVGDKLHCQFNPLRSDDYGTVSGRFSSSNPNLQQVSGKSEEDYIKGDRGEILSGQIIRKLFIPLENCDWMKYDWSQIEYRLIAHYATGEGAEEIRRRYNQDPDTDYHEEMGKMTGLTDRKIVKSLNFGAAYGMGINTMCATYGWNLEEATSVYENYHKKVPFVRETSRRVALKAKKVGFIRTLLDRRARLSNPNKGYVMFNRLIQGSAADIMKKSMVDAYEAGVFNTLHPHLVVHDEYDISKPQTKEGDEAALELKRIMESCVKLRVPIKADVESGPNWGELKKWK